MSNSFKGTNDYGMTNDSKIITPEKFKSKPTRPQKEGVIDIGNGPTMTVYGVQCWVGGINTGTSLYDSQAKQVFVLHTLQREEAEKRKLFNQALLAYSHDNSLPEPPIHINIEYKAINYPVY